jgi:hypothetical protein
MNIENALLCIALSFAFYHVGVDIVIEKEVYPSWLLLGEEDFRKVRNHYEKSLFLFFYLPGIVELTSIAALLYLVNTEVQILLWMSLVLLTANFSSSYFFWARWQQQVTTLDLPPESGLVNKIIHTNWIRTTIVIVNGVVLLIANCIHS